MSGATGNAGVRTLRRLAAWAVVAVPALWGVAQTVAKAGALFR